MDGKIRYYRNNEKNSVTANETEIRFHCLRHNEKRWLSEDIDEYKEAIVIASV
ncbi:hypothetical protein [Clostridium sp. Marseille-P299]|uniref:hypothetical protein n=1 Tax=Clostridium sp. Marseille-P299 TaxID=1805477 RepID=UPI000AC42C13|nr:hypothetical protein [Clostridium sp. Marseille-P299]